MSENPKTVLLGVTGGIAAYKSCEILRGLQKRGHRVQVVMTESATRFVDPLTFRALTHEPVGVDLFSGDDPIPHITLAESCDMFLIAPCTANVMAKIAHGIADDLLTTTALACTAPLMLAPAMNVHMYEAAATQANMAALRARGVRFADAADGYLACGDVGQGRLAEPEAIVDAACSLMAAKSDLAGRSVLVTAGPTVEPIDAVRFISNHSSGKMGYAVARAALDRGAEVTLVSGPVALEAPAGVELISVGTAQEMLEAVQHVFPESDISIFTAAVADMRPAEAVDHKLKKGRDDDALSHVDLVENPDILATAASEKRTGQVVVGFAAETDDVVDHARSKLASKHADLIVANDVSNGKAFGSDVNKAWLVTSGGVEDLPEMSKSKLADAVLDAVLRLL